ncbi:MAG: [protein-PII] uridylyltransferase, partial [Alphaproteobacteria bacterium]|nr:[protein-PII] uridylyltransferase [Alphaproteobacteria bacterium]
ADTIVVALVGFAAENAYPAANPTAADRLAVAAVGGYGRAELAPFSDVDLLFLLPYKETPRIEQVIEFTLYMLWDLGLKVGHATRSVDDCIRLSRAEVTIRTAVLEARWLWGERALFDELRRRFLDDIAAATGPEFVDAKLAERDQRHTRLGDSRYVVEPNIKDGKGGLRDLHTLFWIAKYLYQVDDVAELVERGVLTEREARRFAKAHRFLWGVRVHMHFLAGRAEERLTFDLQAEIGRRMGYADRRGARGVERFMKHYYLHAKEVGDLTGIFCAALEAQHKRRPRLTLQNLWPWQREVAGFRIEGGRLTVASGRVFRDDPVEIIRLFHAAQAHALEVHPSALQLVTRNLRLVSTIREHPEANRLFLEMLTSKNDPETALRRLNEAGVFGRFVPDFGRVVAQMHHDMYHVYTVDEHTIFAIGILNAIEAGRLEDEMPVSSEVVHNIQSRRALYVALLLHDIAKGRGGDHSILGAEVATRLGPRLGLSAEETETVAWLVRYHLVMSNTAFRRDLNDPKTITDFVEVVQSLERLRLLLVLTAADIRAVGPNVWNAWKAALLRDLYFAAEEVISGGHAVEGRDRRVERAQGALGDALAPVGWSAAEIAEHLARGYPSYWLSCDTDTHVYHAGLVREAERRTAPLTIDTRIDRYRDATEITIYTSDHPGLFSRIAGAMALNGANIVDAKIFTLTNGMALDSFSVQEEGGGAFDKPNRLARLAAQIEQTLAGRLRPMHELAKRRPAARRLRTLPIQPRVLVDNKASRTHTVIEVNGRDRPGLLYDVTRALTALGLQIASAHVTTYGERAVDTFYVKDVFGLQVTHEAKLKQVRDALLAALADPAEAVATPAAPA